VKLELGCGMTPTPGFEHHDRWAHSPHVKLTFDLEHLPWPMPTGGVQEIRAIDVFEHLRLEVQEWLDECWRILELSGTLTMRLPAWDNPYSYRDPTHRRVFHKESFNYWCPYAPGTVWHQFGRYYFGEDYVKWWNLVSVETECKDYLYVLRKISL
jgi:hypothetical protein